MTCGDLAVDTNVWVHASNPADPWFAHASDYIIRLQTSSATIAIDPGFTGEPATNTSHIGHEYMRHIQPSMTAYQILLQMASTGRFIPTSADVPPAQKRQIERLVKGSKPIDRRFLRVAANSSRKTLITNDGEDFPSHKWPAIRSLVSVTVRDCANAPSP